MSKSHCWFAQPTYWTPTESPYFTVSDFFKSPSTFKRRPAQRQQPRRDAKLETCLLQGQLELETTQSENGSQPQGGNRSDVGQIQRAQSLERNRDLGARPHPTRSGVGSRAKSCPNPEKGGPGGPLGNKSREQQVKPRTNPFSVTPPQRSRATLPSLDLSKIQSEDGPNNDSGDRSSAEKMSTPKTQEG
jgi:hypothetical protein